MIYTTLFLIGLVGIGAQALLGMGGHGHAGRGHHAAHGHQNAGARTGNFLLSLLSPLSVFSVCLGIGAAGLLLRSIPLPRQELFGVALLGGLFFYALLVRPIWALVFKFASEPAKALDGAVAGTAEALTRFDATGKGLVRVNVDGQIVRVLAFLEPQERTEETVKPGDQLTIISVDGHANTCRVVKI
jgi:hypothetical protein